MTYTKTILAFRDNLPPGWGRVLERLHRSLDSVNPGYKPAVVEQDSEGCLRVKIIGALNKERGPLNRAMASVIRKAQAEALRTCEWCGKPAQQRLVGSKRATLCYTCKP